jgi:hypothetical protein
MYKTKGLIRGGMGILLVVMILCSLIVAATPANAANPPKTSLSVYVNFGTPVTRILVHTYTIPEMTALTQTTEHFKWWKSGGNIMFAKGTGVTLNNLLNDLQTRNPNFDYASFTSIKVADTTPGYPYMKTFTKAQLLNRNYYPHLDVDADWENPIFDLTDAVPVEPIFAILQANNSDAPCISQAALDLIPMDGSVTFRWMYGSTSTEASSRTSTSSASVTSADSVDLFIPTPTYTLAYTAGSNGSISGTTPQTVNYGKDGTAVTAVADGGYHFVNWSDSSTANPRTDTNVTASISVTANFAINFAGQTWYLDNMSTGPVMEKTFGTQTGSVPITAVTWLSAQNAGSMVTFDTGYWTVNLNTTDLTGRYTVQIGEFDGASFNALSTQAAGTANGNPITLTFYIAGATVPQYHYLALQVTNSDSGSVITDGSSYLASPSSTPSYPVPEMTAIVLLGLGLAGLGVFVVIQRRNSQKNRTIMG